MIYPLSAIIKLLAAIIHIYILYFLLLENNEIILFQNSISLLEKMNYYKMRILQSNQFISMLKNENFILYLYINILNKNIN